MKRIVTILLGLSWIALATISARANELNNNTLSQNNPNQNINQPSGTAADLKPNEKEIQAQSMQNSIQQAKDKIERKSLQTRSNRGLENEQPELVAPICVEPCLPSIGSQNQTSDGVGVHWPLKF